MSRLSRQCRILNISQPYRPPWAVMVRAFLFLYIYIYMTSIVRSRTQATELVSYDIMWSLSQCNDELNNTFVLKSTLTIEATDKVLSVSFQLSITLWCDYLCIAPPFFPSSKLEVIFMPCHFTLEEMVPLYLLDKRLSRPQNPSGCCT
jgi:hypothetical protein